MRGFPGSTVIRNLPTSAGDRRDMGSVPESGRSPGEENGMRLQYSCLENSMDRGPWWATVFGAAKSDVTECVHTERIQKVTF